MNENLTYDNSYQGYDIYAKSPLMIRCLDRIESLLDGYVSKCPRVLALRFDLRTPNCFYCDDYPVTASGSLISRFIRSLDEKIKADLKRKQRSKSRTHKTELGYIWAKEDGEDGKEHYHVAILLNADTYYLPGDYNGERHCLATMIIEAWQSALEVDFYMARNLVHFPNNPAYRLNLRSNEFFEVKNRLFYRLSYLAKVDTKIRGRGKRSFGTSRIR
ncbi:inovirus Gp2 family protein [Photobacterium sp. R1]